MAITLTVTLTIFVIMAIVIGLVLGIPMWSISYAIFTNAKLFMVIIGIIIALFLVKKLIRK